MSAYLGDFADNAYVHFSFTTNAADGGRESTSASLEEADIVIYSSDGDGTYTAMTLDASTITITENPGSQVGVYLVAVNMGNDADFTTGKDYIAVFYPDETVDSQSIAGVLAHWSCENRVGYTLLTDTEAVLTDTEAATGVLTDTEAILADTETGLTERATLLTDTEAVLADTEAATAVLTDTEAILSDSEAVLTDSEAILTDTEYLRVLVTTNDTVDNPLATATASTFDTNGLSAFSDTTLEGSTILFTGGSLIGQFREISSFSQANGNVTVASPFTTAPMDSDPFVILPMSVGDTSAILTDTEAVLTDTEAATGVITDTEAILSDTEAVIADTETGITERATLLTDTEAILADTNELQTDDVPTTLATLLTDTEAILVDTNELQTDDIPGTLTTLLTDTEAILTDTESIAASTAPEILATGTIGATGNTTTTLHLTGLGYGNDEINDCLLIITDVSTGEVHSRWIEDWAGTGDLATVATLPFTPQDSTDTYTLLGTRRDVTDTNSASILTDTEAVLADTEAATGVITDTEAILADTETGLTERATLLTDTEAVLVDTEASRVDEAAILVDTEASRVDEAAILVDTEAATGVIADTEAILADTESSQTTEASILADTEASQTAEASLLVDTEAILVDSEAVLTDAEAILADTEGMWTTALTEAYRSTGATGTAAELLYEIMAHLGEFAISGTTKTSKKLDGSTTAKTYTLDDDTNPTSITEAT